MPRSKAPIGRVPGTKTYGMPGGDRSRWRTMENARVWMKLIRKDPRYARLVFATRDEMAEYERSGTFPYSERDEIKRPTN